MQPIKSTTKEPFKLISQDFISGLPKTKQGHDRIMVVVDHGLTKGKPQSFISTIRSKDLDSQTTSYPTETLSSFQKLTEV
ncbi:hypothetical protein K443DRAFT_15646 [Laccaria amethystina LaAM-08-1]|uniref:Uncharacterized protein n=1 Tax=Laccaria amethystina LaAM-08-1 TaxID=1095629 RepID=A0A0C9WGS5_9AGAR|nr:hypothetical protein K443DRAFT_15646 [Laccaria amethystina LaAM-08-1]